MTADEAFEKYQHEWFNSEYRRRFPGPARDRAEADFQAGWDARQPEVDGLKAVCAWSRSSSKWSLSMFVQVDALQRFKDYVHRRLDTAGVPTHPDGPHSKEGCRIGDRMDIVIGERDQLRAQREADAKAACCRIPKSHQRRCPDILANPLVTDDLCHCRTRPGEPDHLPGCPAVTDAPEERE
jgi:hypothetical protein